MDERRRKDKSDAQRNDTTKSLQPTMSDYLVALSRAIAGAVPGYGPAIAEIITFAIPNQRMDRVVKFLVILDKHLSRLDKELVRTQLTNENFNDLLEESVVQAARSLTDERREYIASLVAIGLSKEQAEFSQSKHLLRILSELSDIEVIILRYYAVPTFGEDVEFRRKHEATFQRERAHISSRIEVVDDEAIQTSYREHLANLGLLSRRFDISFEISPRTASSGNELKVKGYDITWLGQLLLRYVGIAPQKPEKKTESRVELIRPDPPT